MAFYSPVLPPQINRPVPPSKPKTYNHVSEPGYTLSGVIVRKNGVRISAESVFVSDDGSMFSYVDKITGTGCLVFNGTKIGTGTYFKPISYGVFVWKTTGDEYFFNVNDNDIARIFGIKLFTPTEMAIRKEPGGPWVFVTFDEDKALSKRYPFKEGFSGKDIDYCGNGRYQVFTGIQWVLVVHGKVEAMSQGKFVCIDFERWFTRDKDGIVDKNDLPSYPSELSARVKGREVAPMDADSFVWMDRNKDINLVIKGKTAFSGVDIKYDYDNHRYLGLNHKKQWVPIGA
jgi:hypothetical protein